MKEQEFDHIIKQKLEAIQDAPPPAVWEQVSAGIQTPAAARLSLWTKLLITASVVLFVVGSVFVISGNHETKRAARNPFKRPINRTMKKPAAKAESNDISTVKTIEDAVSPKPEPKNRKQSPAPAKASELAASKPRTTSNTENKNTAKQVSGHNADTQFTPLNEIDSPEKTSPEDREIAPATATTTAVALAANNSSQTQNAVFNTSNTEFTESVNTEESPEPELAETAEEPEEETPVEETALVVNESVEPEVQPEEVVEAEVVEPELAENTNEEVNEAAVTEAEQKADAEENKELTEASTEYNDPKSRKLNQYGIGIHYGPEFMNFEDHSYTDHAFDLSFNYQNLNFTLQTGLGLRFSQDRVDYEMKYQKWEYLETQIRFDSATFVLDANGNPVLVPVDPYYEEVYDSIKHTYTATAKENYTMLQIPLLAGYQYDRANFGLFVKGGIRYSVVIIQTTSGLFDPGDNAHLEYLNYPKKTRLKSNIDYELALGVSYRINKRFMLQLEGTGRYYHYSIFDDDPGQTNHPTSFSARAGLIYIFK